MRSFSFAVQKCPFPSFPYFKIQPFRNSLYASILDSPKMERVRWRYSSPAKLCCTGKLVSRPYWAAARPGSITKLIAFVLEDRIMGIQDVSASADMNIVVEDSDGST
mmetsp:Transcript_4985/g.11063  ORF Transcript_4985/g.11063 Transcript_4985/m.11063 type:complete len:107 (+) Transcript_4985:793-1113(+)